MGMNTTETIISHFSSFPLFFLQCEPCEPVLIRSYGGRLTESESQYPPVYDIKAWIAFLSLASLVSYAFLLTNNEPGLRGKKKLQLHG